MGKPKKSGEPAKAAVRDPVVAVEIESGIDVPIGGGRGMSYPFDQLKVGQSFKIPNRTKPGSAMVASANKSKKCNGAHFLCRFVTAESEQDGIPGVRFWRNE